MPSDTKNVKLGVCNVTFGATDLGYTKGGVEVAVATETHKVNVDQFGNTTINEYILGREVTVTVPLAETTLENLVATMPGATLVQSGTTPTKKKVSITTGVGISLLDLAQKLVLHPTANLPANKTDDFTVPKAMTAGQITFAYKKDEERIYNVVFTGYPDPATGIVAIVGDESATTA
ncbi:hypothetical protein [Inquilinus sp. OTU3971]|uniref:hypothetical protein n=1 Tax=Inquilinus sp. OTU3971 TaxID=3043855 RepID=UPI00313D9C79